MSGWLPPDLCALCGNDVMRELRWSLVKWAVAEPGMSYEHIGRCNDETYCRQRVADQGETWPLAAKEGVKP